MNTPKAMTCDSKNLKASDDPVFVPIRPSKIRMAIVMMVFVYPIVTLLLYALNPLADNWAVWHRTLVLTPITVSLIVFVVSPFAIKHLDWFLRPRAAPGRGTN
ncbi:hypothetical protein PHLH4_35760 [Pseudomonas sp. St316]|nr:hypothetical protein PHLH4_35760 [Pseudomonas sp. St316]